MFSRSSKASKRVDRLLGFAPTNAQAKAHAEWELAKAVHQQLLDTGVTDVFVGPPAPGNLVMALSLRRLAEKPLPAAKRGRGRPSAVAPPPPPLSRQERRYRERMVSKAAEAWDRATNGAGVVLVGGKPVPVKGGKS